MRASPTSTSSCSRSRTARTARRLSGLRARRPSTGQVRFLLLLLRHARSDHKPYHYADRPFSLATLPYANHVVRLPPGLQSAAPDALEPALANAFLGALDLAIQTLRSAPPASPSPSPPSSSSPSSSSSLSLSYNVLLTLEHVHVIPRAREAHALQATGETLSVNALGFAGMLLVKSARELEAVTGEGVGHILRGVGVEAGLEAQADGHVVADEAGDA